MASSRSSPPHDGAKRKTPPNELRGKALYDLLYSVGYHSKSSTTRAQPLLSAILITAKASSSLGSVLDVGCSHGFAVKSLWEAGFRASGVDISHVAIAAARRARDMDQTRA